jgi:hypothetical protein
VLFEVVKKTNWSFLYPEHSMKGFIQDLYEYFLGWVYLVKGKEKKVKKKKRQYYK